MQSQQMRAGEPTDGADRKCTIQESAKAKHVRLRVSLRDGSLTVVIPKGFDRREIPKVLEQKRRWIERAQRQVAEQRRQAGPEGGDGLPEAISLRAIDQQWRVEYARTRPERETDPPDGERLLTVVGGVEDEDGCKQALCCWLQRMARAHLVPWLLTLSGRHDLSVTRVTVRSQRARWGSCSERNCVNLNQKLLFLPAALVEQVMLHELCHTRHHNHSERFWRLLQSLSPDCRSREAELRTAWRYLPAWLDRRV